MPNIRAEVIQGTPHLMVLQTLRAMGPLDGHGITRRMERLSSLSATPTLDLEVKR